MEPLLYLVHRIPYPPNKGDKVRSYHLLKYLAEHYRVYLGTFVDDPHDWGYLTVLEGMCEEIHAVPLHSVRARVRSLKGLATGQALTLPYYWSPDMSAWVKRVVAEAGIRRVVVFSSAMAQYLPEGQAMRRVVDFVDVDSDKWRQYADNKPWPMSWLYRREHRKLLQFDRATADKVDASVFVSEEEARFFRDVSGVNSDKIRAVPNGVDCAYFDPARGYSNPYTRDGRRLVFTGAMDYWPNVDAATWFAREVFPRIRVQCPDTTLFVVGARPAEEVTRLGSLDGVTVTGRVDDMRPYIAHASLAVAPLRIARGIQNKVLEALAMDKVVVASDEAAEGIGHCNDLIRVPSNAPEAFAETCVDRLSCLDAGGEAVGRNFVRRHFDWTTNLSEFPRLLEST